MSLCPYCHDERARYVRGKCKLHTAVDVRVAYLEGRAAGFEFRNRELDGRPNARKPKALDIMPLSPAEKRWWLQRGVQS